MFSQHLRTILAFDTSAGAVSAAVLRDGHILAELLEPVLRGHGEVIMGLVKSAVAQAGIGFADLDAIVVTEGPGSFTGIRVGLAAARGLGLALGIPVLGVSTLLVHAASVASAALKADASIMVVIDSKRADLYVQHFASDLTPLDEPHLVAVGDLGGEIGGAPVIVTGDAAHLVEKVPDGATVLPTATPAIAVVASLAFATGHASPATPLYIRAPDAARPIAGGQAPVTGAPEPVPAPAAIVIDQVGLSHVPVLATLHAQCFQLGWTEASFVQSMASANVLAWLALLEPDREPVGFMVVRVVEDEAEILTLGVLRHHRRRGIARQLLAQATARASSASAVALFLEVAEGNQAARGLYRKAGFHAVGRRANYYPSPDGSSEAAIVMRRDLRA